jgi:hypothetical protein
VDIKPSGGPDGTPKHSRNAKARHKSDSKTVGKSKATGIYTGRLTQWVISENPWKFQATAVYNASTLHPFKPLTLFYFGDEHLGDPASKRYSSIIKRRDFIKLVIALRGLQGPWLVARSRGDFFVRQRGLSGTRMFR